MASRIEAEARADMSIDPLINWDLPDYEVNTSRRHRLLSRILGLQSDEEVEAERIAEREAERSLPEWVAPDDPWRLALEARMRAVGIRPATVWNWPVRKPIRKPDWRDWLRNRLGG
ncbi:hypothetical protein [Longimicrobium terrae]|nr:hypothetical protein [Longimicrobium terrae]NNC27864.1 hypothetical protein [Longimicrobium terrae]